MSVPVKAQTMRWCVGLAGGGARGVNEDLHQAILPYVRIEGVAFSDTIPNASPAVGISLLSLSSKEQGEIYSYSTSIVAPDIRARFSPVHTAFWFPYVNLGFGVGFFHVTNKPPAIGSGAETDGSVVFFPIGLGVFHRLTDHVAADLNLSDQLTLSDDINPVHDGKYDAWWTMSVSLYFAF